VLRSAVAEHADGQTTDNPTVAVCWDADRLNLWRVGHAPDERLLSTVAARDPETIEWARGLQDQPVDWLDVMGAYEQL
jgi:uncharacterized protein